MSARYPELEEAAAKLDSVGDERGADAVRKASDKLDACESEIERLLVDVESLSQRLEGERARR